MTSHASGGGAKEKLCCHILCDHVETAEIIRQIGEQGQISCSVFRDVDDFAEAAVNVPAAFFFIADWLVVDIACLCERIRLSVRSAQIILVTSQKEMKNRELQKLSADNVIFHPPNLETLKKLFVELKETWQRLKNLEMFSLNNRKQEIIEEISSFGSHLKTITRMKERSVELEERIEELQVAKERLAAEIRARETEITKLGGRLADREKEIATLQHLIGKLESSLESRDERVETGRECLKVVSHRLQELIDGTDYLPLAKGNSAHLRQQIQKLEEQQEQGYQVFNQILEILMEFISAEQPDLDKTFEQIIDCLATYTNI
jgi:chromosome segregation ATPase